MIRVLNLLTQETKLFFSSTGHRDAVIVSHAQSKLDFNTWEYDNKYKNIVQETERCLFCGDWATRKDFA